MYYNLIKGKTSNVITYKNQNIVVETHKEELIEIANQML